MMTMHNLGSFRTQTRRQRYSSKHFVKLPVSIATVHFLEDRNLGFLVRAAACFGAAWVDVIGSLPPSNVLKKASATTSDFTNLNLFPSIQDFVDSRKDADIVCAEITSDSNSILEYKYNFNKHTCIIIGNESIGVPGPLTMKYPTVHIPMLGPGFCLNNAQTANVMLFDYMSKYITFNKEQARE